MREALGLAIAAAVAWGTADFCAKRASARLGFWGTFLGTNVVGCLALFAAAGAGWVAPFGPDWRFWIVLALGNTAAGLLFYFALEYGRLSLISPVTAAFPVVSVALAYIFAHEHLGAPLALAVTAVIAGTMITAASGHASAEAGPRERQAVVAAACSALIFGAVFYGLGRDAGAFTVAPILMFRLVGAIALATPMLAGRLPGPLWRSGWLWATGLLDSGAYLLYVASLRHLPVAIAAPVGGLFTIWTLLLARVFLREHLSRRQWLGIALILTAIGLLAGVHA